MSVEIEHDGHELYEAIFHTVETLPHFLTPSGRIVWKLKILALVSFRARRPPVGRSKMKTCRCEEKGIRGGDTWMHFGYAS